jgi:hypothetical protein
MPSAVAIGLVDAADGTEAGSEPRMPFVFVLDIAVVQRDRDGGGSEVRVKVLDVGLAGVGEADRVEFVTGARRLTDGCAGKPLASRRNCVSATESGVSKK